MHTATLPPTTCTDTSCQHAFSHVSLCTCSCGGTGHASAHKPHFPAPRSAYHDRLARHGGDVFALIPGSTDTDDDAF